MNHCRDCKHYSPPSRESLGICVIATTSYGSPDHPNSMAYAIDVHPRHYAELRVSPDFGCVQFEPKEQGCAACGTVRDQTERARPAVNENAMNRIDMFGSGQIDWHPVIYEKGESPLSVLRVSLMHVRAANDIDIEYSSERDGWVIYQDVTVGWKQVEDVMEPLEERREKAFIPAWDDDEVSEP